MHGPMIKGNPRVTDRGGISGIQGQAANSSARVAARIAVASIRRTFPGAEATATANHALSPGSSAVLRRAVARRRAGIAPSTAAQARSSIRSGTGLSASARARARPARAAAAAEGENEGQHRDEKHVAKHRVRLSEARTTPIVTPRNPCGTVGHHVPLRAAPIMLSRFVPPGNPCLLRAGQRRRPSSYPHA
jgi:hypothetical protein